MPKRNTDLNAPYQSIKNTSFLTGLSQGYIRNGCKTGTIPHIMIGTEYRINVPALLAQLNDTSTGVTAT